MARPPGSGVVPTALLVPGRDLHRSSCRGVRPGRRTARHRAVSADHPASGTTDSRCLDDSGLGDGNRDYIGRLAVRGRADGPASATSRWGVRHRPCADAMPGGKLMAKTPSLELADMAASTDAVPERSQQMLETLPRL